jgi:hypothetical protein
MSKVFSDMGSMFITSPYQLALQPFVGLGLLHQQPPSNKISSGFTYKCSLHSTILGREWSEENEPFALRSMGKYKYGTASIIIKNTESLSIVICLIIQVQILCEIPTFAIRYP